MLNSGFYCLNTTHLVIIDKKCIRFARKLRPPLLLKKEKSVVDSIWELELEFWMLQHQQIIIIIIIIITKKKWSWYIYS
jgi:hypothetical protein